MGENVRTLQYIVGQSLLKTEPGLISSALGGRSPHTLGGSCQSFTDSPENPFPLKITCFGGLPCPPAVVRRLAKTCF
jgi:hypothetical protein